MDTAANTGRNGAEKQSIARYGSVRDVAARTGISVSILNKRRQAGLPPKWFKPAGLDRVLYDFDDVDAWVRGDIPEGKAA
jgi:hypothetical protein